MIARNNFERNVLLKIKLECFIAKVNHFIHIHNFKYYFSKKLLIACPICFVFVFFKSQTLRSYGAGKNILRSNLGKAI